MSHAQALPLPPASWPLQALPELSFHPTPAMPSTIAAPTLTSPFVGDDGRLCAAMRLSPASTDDEARSWTSPGKCGCIR
jgi:hypothetical protein